MSATFNWSVQSMSCYPQADGETDVVFSVVFMCSGSETINGTTYSASVNGGVPVTYVAGEPFTPYNQLTQSQVLNWVFAALGQDGVSDNEAAVQTLINNQTNPPVVMPPLPWAPAA